TWPSTPSWGFPGSNFQPWPWASSEASEEICIHEWAKTSWTSSSRINTRSGCRCEPVPSSMAESFHFKKLRIAHQRDPVKQGVVEGTIAHAIEETPPIRSHAATRPWYAACRHAD